MDPIVKQSIFSWKIVNPLGLKGLKCFKIPFLSRFPFCCADISAAYTYPGKTPNTASG